jgi:transcriptional regulator with XRE-family HTH domain
VSPAAERTVFALALGGWVRQAREAAGLQQGELGSRAGVSQATVSRMETGAKVADVYALGLVAGALGSTTAGMLAAVERTAAAMYRAGCALCSVETQREPDWEWLLETLGLPAVAALAHAAARVWLAERKPAKKHSSPEAPAQLRAAVTFSPQHGALHP